MTKEEYEKARADLARKQLNEQVALARSYAESNNVVKIGDTISDHIGGMIVDRIESPRFINEPQCMYYGIELTKQGEPMKRQSGRAIFQKNITNHKPAI